MEREAGVVSTKELNVEPILFASSLSPAGNRDAKAVFTGTSLFLFECAKKMLSLR
jgi:hypothetical protein